MHYGPVEHAAAFQRESVAEVRRRGARQLAARGDIRSATELLRHNGGSAPAELRGLLRDVADDKRAELRTIEAALSRACAHVPDPDSPRSCFDCGAAI